MYSPLRYPGGKGKLYHKVREIIEQNNLQNRTYVEPFAGGFGIGIRLLLDNVVPRVILNDLDSHIYNFWYSVINHTDELCLMIQNVDITIQEREIQKGIYNNGGTVLQDGFATLFLNRVNYSGVIKAGPIGGYAQQGNYTLCCRFNRNRLVQQIRAIAAVGNRIELYNNNASTLIENVLRDRKAEIFLNIDPPYVVKGAQLYRNFFNEEDHIALANVIMRELANTPWILTYDDVVLIRDLYQAYHMVGYSLNHSAGGSKQGQELIVFNNITYHWN